MSTPPQPQPTSPYSPSSNTSATSSSSNPNPNTESSDHTPPKMSKEAIEAQAAFTASLRSVGANYETVLRDRARTLHENAASVEKQKRELARTTAELARQNEGWEKVAEQARVGLKEIGDVQNWAELLERDLLIVEETVRLAEEREMMMVVEEGEEEEDENEEEVVEGGRRGAGVGVRVGEGDENHEGHNGLMNGKKMKKDKGEEQESVGKRNSGSGGWFSWW